MPKETIKQHVKDDTRLVALIREHRLEWSYAQYEAASGESKAFICERMRRLRLTGVPARYNDLIVSAVSTGTGQFVRMRKEISDYEERLTAAMEWIRFRYELNENHLKKVETQIRNRTLKARGGNASGKMNIDAHSGYLKALRLPMNRIAEAMV